MEAMDVEMNEKGQWCAWVIDDQGQRVLLNCFPTPDAARFAQQIYIQNNRRS